MTGIEKFWVARADGVSLRTMGLARRCACLAILMAASWLQPGCTTDYASPDPAFPGDFQSRHNIVLAAEPTRMDIYPVGGSLDARTAANLRSFAKRYREFGSGEIAVLVPGRAGSATHAVNQIRQVLRNSGLPSRIRVGSYVPYDYSGAAPIRVAFMGLKAEVKTPCGLWPEDLASGSSLEGWRNEPYYNFGCATQSVVAAQVDDPRDFVRARAPEPSDVAMRMRAIEAVRLGQDPTTSWSTGLTPIGGGVQ